jgi:type II secretory pathway component PulF
MTTEFYVALLLPPALILAGLTLLWLRAAKGGRSVFASDRRPPVQNGAGGPYSSPATAGRASHLGSRIQTALGWSLLLAGLAGAIVLMTHGFSLVVLIVTAVVLGAAFREYFGAERGALLWSLMTAAERGIPLREAAEAFAAEHGGRVGFRAALLADYLEAGLPLALALQRSGHRVSHGVLLAAEVGERTGTLGPALRRAVGETDEVENASRSLLEGFFYLAFLLIFTCVMASFLAINILPVFFQMFREFGIEMAPVTRFFAEATGFAPALGLLASLLGWLVLGGLYYYLRGSARDLPLIRAFWWRADAALILRWLAVAVEQKRSIATSLRLLIGYVSRRSLRRRLAKTAALIDSGQHWCDSLLRSGVIRGGEAAVLKAAERAGNLAWALEQLAATSVRRTAWRMRAWQEVTFPATVLLIGGGVSLIVSAVFISLITFIQALT